MGSYRWRPGGFHAAAPWLALLLTSSTAGLASPEIGGACHRRHLGVSLPRVRGHLLAHFGSWDPGAGRAAASARRAAAAAREALEADERLNGTAVREMLLGVIRLRVPGYHCRLAGAALRLLRCVEAAASGCLDLAGCCSGDVEGDLRLALGLADLGLSEVLRSGWPVHGLAAALAASSLEGRGGVAPGALGGGRRRAALLEEAAIARLARSHASGVAAAETSTAAEGLGIDVDVIGDLFTRICPYRYPFDFHCGAEELERPRTHLAAAAVHAALAIAAIRHHRRLAEQGDRGEGRCAGLERICPDAALHGDVEEHIQQAQEELGQSARAPAPLPMTSPGLLSAAEPLLGLLARVASLLAGRDVKGPPPTAQRSAPCSCDMSTWRAGDAAAAAAALRALERLRGAAAAEAGASPEAVLEVAGSEDAQAACGVGGLGEDASMQSMGIIAVAFQGLRGGWEDASAGPGSLHTDEEVVEAARLLHNVPAADFGAELCLPGATALAMVCLLVSVERRMWSWRPTLEEMVMTLLLGTEMCVATAGDGSPAVDGAYLDDWLPLAAWQREPGAIFRWALEPLVRSNVWWLGRELEADPPAPTVDASFSNCAGIYDSEPCLMSDSGVVSRGHTAGARTRVLGVGLMKGGSTLVVQALRAATRWPMGMDCTAAKLVSDVRAGAEPLQRLLGRCSEELFKWELAKDPLLTPLARRLANVWPAVASQPGARLRIYFLVRHPLDFVRSFLRHLELAVDGGGPEQAFTPGNWPHHRRFTAAKRQYLDVRREGLRYTGYVDAAAQRWALTVDEYLRCPEAFVLARYEDFASDPAAATRELLRRLGLGSFWSEEAAERVRLAASFRYQAPKGAPSGQGGDRVADFGPALHARLVEAVMHRGRLLGYTDLEAAAIGDSGVGVDVARPLDMPTLPGHSCEP